jgi:hypothetical protein
MSSKINFEFLIPPTRPSHPPISGTQILLFPWLPRTTMLGTGSNPLSILLWGVRSKAIEKLIVSQLVTHSAPKGSLLCSSLPDIGPCSIHNIETNFRQIHFSIILLSTQRFLWSLPLRFCNNFLRIYHLPMRATCRAQLTLLHVSPSYHLVKSTRQGAALSALSSNLLSCPFIPLGFKDPALKDHLTSFTSNIISLFVDTWRDKGRWHN